MHELIFATHNQNKVIEVASVLNEQFQIKSLSELELNEEIEEPFDTIRENAIEKAGVVFKWTGKNCFSEDTGLEVAALNGEPGVKSARYAGDNRNFEANIDKLLHELAGEENRKARFLTIICLILHGNHYIFEGICNGVITLERKGDKGFGYDSVFKPEGSDQTFAQMEMSEKNIFSHRRKAIDKLIAFLQEQ